MPAMKPPIMAATTNITKERFMEILALNPPLEPRRVPYFPAMLGVYACAVKPAGWVASTPQGLA
jgi:hypothetical protein